MDVFARLSNGSDLPDGCDADSERPSCLLTTSEVMLLLSRPFSSSYVRNALSPSLQTGILDSIAALRMVISCLRYIVEKIDGEFLVQCYSAVCLEPVH